MSNREKALAHVRMAEGLIDSGRFERANTHSAAAQVYAALELPDCVHLQGEAMAGQITGAVETWLHHQ